MVMLKWNKGLQFIASNQSGQSIIVDTDKEFGGLDQGFRPMELLLAAQAGCMAMDIIAILQKKGGKVDNFEITIKGERADQHPKRFIKIIVDFKCEGNYKREDLLRSFELSREKYCSVFATLKHPPEFKFNL